MNKKLSIIGLAILIVASCFSGCVEDTTISVEEFVLMISEIYYNATGNMTNEFIEFYVVEADGSSINISGWYVTTFDNDEEYLTSISDLEQFDYIALRMGAGTNDLDASDGGATIYLDRNESMLDIPGDEIGLYNADDELVDFVRYNGGNNDSILGGWDRSDLGAIANNSMESIQIHGQDMDNSSNWISAPPSPAEPNIDEWLMDSGLGLHYQIHNGVSFPVDLTDAPATRPSWNIINESGPVSNEDKDTIKNWLNHTYEYMNSRGLGVAQNASDGKVHIHITKENKPPSGRSGGAAWGTEGHSYINIGNLSNRNESILAKQTVEHEHIHLIQYSHSHSSTGTYGPGKDYSDLEGMAEFWATEIAMDNYNLTLDDYLAIHNEVYDRVGSGYDWDRWMRNTDRDFFKDFVVTLDYYWANHMFLRYIREVFGEEKIRRIFRARNVTAGDAGIINVVNKAFEQQPEHNVTFEDLFINWTIWIWENYGDRITLARNVTFDGNTTINESGSLNPWGVDYERIASPTNNDSKITFKGDANKSYSITIIKREQNETTGGETTATYRFTGEIDFEVVGHYSEIILIKRQLNCNTSTSYNLSVIAYDIGNHPPNTPSSPSPSNASTNVSVETALSWTGGDPDGDVVTYDVYFCIEITPSQVVSNQTATSYTPEMLDYEITYYWKIVAWDIHGVSSTGPIWHFTAEAENIAPVAYASADPTSGYAPLEVDFTGEGVDSDGEIVSYSWDFGDGNTSDEQNPTHVYENSDSYTVELVVTDDDGGTGTDTLTITVNETGILLSNISGYVIDNLVDKMAIYIRPIAGSTDIAIENISIEISNSSTEVQLDYNSDNYNNSPSDIFECDCFNLTNLQFGLIVLDDSDASCTQENPVINAGDWVILTVNTTSCFEGLPPSTSVTGSVTPETGTAGVISFVTPSEYDTIVELQ